jgi:dimethylargininase
MAASIIKGIVRRPGLNFAEGLTEAGLGTPSFSEAVKQHGEYVQGLKECGVEVIALPVIDTDFPDATFVEDTAIITGKKKIMITRPGALSRFGEVAAMKESILTYFHRQHQEETDRALQDLDVKQGDDMTKVEEDYAIEEMKEPGTLDGGDVCAAGSTYFIGISKRTNEAGAQQLAEWLDNQGYTSHFVDIRHLPLLHLKSGMTFIPPNHLVLIPALDPLPVFASFHRIVASSEEEYAANTLFINGQLLFPAGFPLLESQLRLLGYPIRLLSMSEFRKMDGSLTCLSLLFP